MIAAINRTIAGLQPVAQDSDPAIIASGSQSVDSALQAIEDVALAGHHNLESLVILIAASFTTRHNILPFFDR
jgi:hypothetical protein